MNLKSQLNISLLLKFFMGFVLISPIACHSQKADVDEIKISESDPNIILGIELTENYLPLIKGKAIGLVSNHTSIINNIHLLDTMLELGVNVKKVYSPEHGFRGDADRGELVKSQIDEKTGVPIVSLYGKNKKPSPEQLNGIEVLVFDIQDVGARFYTYISTLHYVMEAASENDISVIVLDRPNPNGNYIDGPILEKEFKSFIGMHPIPIVHGMTIGEYAKMINGEGWLKNEIKCDLTVISCEQYDHNMEYRIAISPSPNLPNMASIYNYPSICFFEGTPLSLGRGTDLPFQQIGHPDLKNYSYTFTPKPSRGSKNPKLNGAKCYGQNLSKEIRVSKLNLSYLLEFYNKFPKKEKFFTDFFNLLAGNSKLSSQIKEGMTEEEIRNTWSDGLRKFSLIRNKYLLYPDFD